MVPRAAPMTIDSKGKSGAIPSESTGFPIAGEMGIHPSMAGTETNHNSRSTYLRQLNYVSIWHGPRQRATSRNSCHRKPPGRRDRHDSTLKGCRLSRPDARTSKGRWNSDHLARRCRVADHGSFLRSGSSGAQNPGLSVYAGR